VGVETDYVGSTGHAWNIVKINGKKPTNSQGMGMEIFQLRASSVVSLPRKGDYCGYNDYNYSNYYD
jgi:hypothetical protein